jgi:probable HAF family extracellular repeat protein
MKSRTWMWTTAVSLFAALAIPVNIAAQDNEEQHHKPRHHTYRLIDLGTFGGPNSLLNTGDPPNFPNFTILSRAGVIAAVAETPNPDQFAPNFCFVDCNIGYVFRWQNGVASNLGALPENPATGFQTACLDCNWSSWAYSIADDGLVVGQSEDNGFDPLLGAPAYLAVLWKNGKIVNLGTLGGYESTAGGVNNRGDVVGAALNSITDPFPGRCPYCAYFIFGNATESHAFLWQDGKMRDLGTLGGPDSIAFFVNENGQVAGASDVDFESNPVTGGPTVHPFLWDQGQMLDLTESRGAKFGGTYGTVSAMNNQGQVTGTMNLTGDLTWHSFLWSRGSMTDLGTLGGTVTSALWMNEAGHIVGRSDVTEICKTCGPNNQKQLPHPFLWKDGAMVDLGLLYADTGGAAVSVNARDQVVGHTAPCTHIARDHSCDGVYHPFLWENGTIVDLQALVRPSSDITLIDARDINDRGEIAAFGVLPNGDQHAVLLVPDGDCDDDCNAGLVGHNSAAPAQPLEAAQQGGESVANKVDQLHNRSTGRYHVPIRPLHH